jgi:hypothetical protein
MAIYVVLEPDAASLSQAQVKAVMVRDGFTFGAFILPVVWLLFHRLWIEALGALALMLAAGALAIQLGGHPLLGSVLCLMTQIYFGLEAANLRVAALRRRRWHLWGPVEAVNKHEAELRYAASADARAVVLQDTPWPQRPAIGQPAMQAAGANTFPWER